MDTKASPLEFLASFVLPESILDWFEVIKAEEKAVNPSEKDKYQAELHLYLDERDNRSVADVFLTPNGFTEPTVVEDFPVRDRKFVLHIRRRRWKDEQGRNIILSTYPLVAEGTRISPEFAAFLKVPSPSIGNEIKRTHTPFTPYLCFGEHKSRNAHGA